MGAGRGPAEPRRCDGPLADSLADGARSRRPPRAECGWIGAFRAHVRPVRRPDAHRYTGRVTRTRRSSRLALVATGAILLPALAGCALLEGPTPATPQREAPAKPEQRPELVPGGSAEQNLPYFTEVLREYGEGEAPIEGVGITTALRDAGFDTADMQVSFDETRTGLVADSIYVSVRIGTECMLGQFATEDRELVVDLAGAVGPEQDICLIGETRTIDW